MKSYRKEFLFFCTALILTILVTNVIAETLYVDGTNGNDTDPGTRRKPLRTLDRAAQIINDRKETGSATIKIAPGIYNLDDTVIFESSAKFTEKDRLIIEATVLPGEPNWNPAFMPVILSTQNPKDPNEPGRHTETYSLKVKTNHVTIRGLKFMGNPLVNNWHACIERAGTNLDDLTVSRCMFVGGRDSLDIYVGVIGTGDRIVIDHCIFYKCHAPVVFWDGLDGIGQKGCAMRNCIVRDSFISGAWTCQTNEDFDFRNNIITGCEYFWIRRQGDKQKYKIRNCIVTDNKFYSGYGVASGPTGQTGAEVTYDEENVVRQGRLVFEDDKKSKRYLHIVESSFGDDVKAGLFEK